MSTAVPVRAGRHWSAARAAAAVLAVAVTLVAGACSSSSDDPSSTASSETRSTAATTTTEVTASSACGTADQAAIDTLQVTVGDRPRTSTVHLPRGWDGQTPLPVVISLHGATSDPPTMALMDGFDAKADQEQFIVVRPEGSIIDVSPTIAGVRSWDLTGREVDDVAFLASLLDELGRSVCTDPSRVFATGFSMGGEMAMAAACALPDRIAAFGAVAASRDVSCEVGGSSPAITFHGTSDLVAPYDGAPSVGMPPVEDTMAGQARRNGCDPDPDVEQVAPTVALLTWTGCSVPTLLYRVDDHGHAWPGHPLPASRDAVAAALRGTEAAPNPVPAAMSLTAEEMADNVLLTNTAIDATDLMWAFFTANA